MSAKAFSGLRLTSAQSVQMQFDIIKEPRISYMFKIPNKE